MDYKKLLEKYNILLEQVDRLTKENRRLKAKLRLQEAQDLQVNTRPIQMEISVPGSEAIDVKPNANITSVSDSISKIRLFMSIFKGRGDVYARRWENQNKGTSGYAPVCLNQWQPGLCGKPKIPCSKCKNKSYAVLDDNAIEDHLRGNTVDKAFLKGSGVGEPLGVLNSPCLIEVPKESGQTADTITYMNLANMMAAMHSACFANSVWVCHQTAIPQLLSLTIDIGTGGAHIPVMRESDGKFTMLTRPVVFTEKTEVLGDKGDILLADFSQYCIGLNEEMRIDFSPHLYFNTDEMAGRLIERHDGEPLWNEALTLQDGSTTVSPFVTLAERA